MKTNMEEIDLLIKETLTSEEAKFYDDLEEQNVFEMIIGVYKGKNRWIMYIMNFVMLVCLVLFIYCANNFLKTDITNDLIYWGALGMVCLLTISMLKIFAWMQMDKNAIIREMKRIELQISSLSGGMK